MIALLPDIIIIVTAVTVLLFDAFGHNENGSGSRRLAMLGTLAALLVLIFLRSPNAEGLPTYALTPMGTRWRLIFLIALFTTQILSGTAFKVPLGSKNFPLTRPGAFHALLLFCTTGMFAIVSAREWITFFLGLELATLPLFALVGFRSRSGSSVEAAAKLMVMAGMATALNLFGISLLYGAAGDLTFESLTLAASEPTLLMYLGAMLMLGGLGFKIAALPLHMWAPDVYGGAPLPVTAFLSVGSKAAGLAAMAAIFFGPLNAMRPLFFPIFAFMAVASMVVGNLGAMRQTHILRFIGYSSISQAGYFLLAFTGDTSQGVTALWFNLLVYGAGTMTLFFVIGSLDSHRPEMRSLHGLSKHKPGLAFLLLLAMFSLAGIPPLAGFLGKFQIFSVVAKQHHYALVFIAIANAVFSLYYYLRPIKAAYLASSEEELPMYQGSFLVTVTLWLLGLSVVVLGLWPLGLSAP